MPNREDAKLIGGGCGAPVSGRKVILFPNLIRHKGEKKVHNNLSDEQYSQQRANVGVAVESLMAGGLQDKTDWGVEMERWWSRICRSQAE